MEIKFLNINLKSKNKLIIKNLNLTIKSSEINGIYKDSYNIIRRLLLNKEEFEGTILIDKKNYKSFNKKKISYISPNLNFLTKKVSDEFYLIKKDLNDKGDYIKKIISSLNMVGLSKDYLDLEINTLSKSEKKLLKIAINLVTNPDIIIFEDYSSCLDRKSKLKIKEIILELKRKYEKTIIIVDNNINNLYDICSYLIIFKENNVLISDKLNIVFSDLNFLIDNDIDLPNILEFIMIASKYNKKISYTKDINDLIKDVYKNVKETEKNI